MSTKSVHEKKLKVAHDRLVRARKLYDEEQITCDQQFFRALETLEAQAQWVVHAYGADIALTEIRDETGRTNDLLRTGWSECLLPEVRHNQKYDEGRERAADPAVKRFKLLELDGSLGLTSSKHKIQIETHINSIIDQLVNDDNNRLGPFCSQGRLLEWFNGYYRAKLAEANIEGMKGEGAAKLRERIDNVERRAFARLRQFRKDCLRRHRNVSNEDANETDDDARERRRWKRLELDGPSRPVSVALILGAIFGVGLLVARAGAPR